MCLSDNSFLNLPSSSCFASYQCAQCSLCQDCRAAYWHGDPGSDPAKARAPCGRPTASRVGHTLSRLFLRSLSHVELLESFPKLLISVNNLVRNSRLLGAEWSLLSYRNKCKDRFFPPEEFCPSFRLRF